MVNDVKISHMKVKKYFIIPLVIVLCACASKNGNGVKYSFRHQQGTTDYGDYLYYNDNAFDGDSTTFNPKLASVSISFAMASFASMEITDYANKSQNAETLLNKLGFKEFETNDWFKKKPEADSIGLLAANKRIGDYTLVAVGVRGAAYFSEWASNFTLGNREDGYHEGFRTAADNLVQFTKDYISAHKISGDIKLWTAGYSRAGATCNVASGLIDESLNKGEKLFGDSVNLTRNHFYSYCFEAPQGAPNKRNADNHVIVKTSDFNNIFNLLNVNDPVPLVAMHELGFARYGVDMYMPDPLLNLDYEGHFNNMKKLYESVENHVVLGDYAIDKFTYKGMSNNHKMTQGLLLKEVIEHLTTDGISHNGAKESEEYLPFYADHVQTGLRNLFKTLYESEAFKGSFIDLGMAMVNDLGIIDEVDILVNDLMVEGPSTFVKDFKPILTRGLNKLGLEVDVKQTVDELIEFLTILGYEFYAAVLSGKTYMFLSFFNKDNLKAIASGHYPELCAAHVRALDDWYVSNPFNDYTKMDGQYYIINVYDDDTSIVIKNNGKEIVRINDGEEINNSIPYCKRKSGYEIYLPYHENYTLELSEIAIVDVSYFNSEYQEILPISSGNIHELEF